MSPPPMRRTVACPGRKAHACSPARICLEQPGTCRLHEIEHFLEAARSPVVGVGDVQIAPAEPPGRRSPPDRTRAAASPWRAPPRRAPVAAARACSSCPSQARGRNLRNPPGSPGGRCRPAGSPGHAPRRRRAGRAGCPRARRRCPRSPARSAPASPASRTSAAHHALGGGRAADVAQADEQQPRRPHPGRPRGCGRRRRLVCIYSSPSSSTARKASWGTSTRPTCFIRFLPSFCFSSSFFLRVMSPP